MKKRTTDCLVIGGGLAGWSAAWEAAQAGVSVTLLHDGMGASPWVHGLCVPLLPEDSVDSFLSDTLQSGQGLSDPRLARALCEDAPKVFEALQKMGLAFNRSGEGYQLLRPLGASHPRVASIGNETGVAVLEALRKGLAGRVQELPQTRALRLAVGPDGVNGALAYDAEAGEWIAVSAKAVVLACGGFCRLYPFSTNKRDCGGDGPAMAYYAGAILQDMEFIQFEPSAAVWPPELRGTSVITTLFYEGAVLRNRQGERFMTRYGQEAERVGKDVLARRIAAEIAQGLGTEHGGVYFDATGVSRETLQKEYPMYLKRYQNVGIDLSTTPVELAPAPHTALGGVQTDEEGRAGVAGLFACGESIGGLHGANRIGGSAGLETLVFGFRAGRGAAAWAKDAGFPLAEIQAPETGGTSIRQALERLRAQMQKALEAAGPLREGAALERAGEALRQGLAEIKGLRGADSQEAFLRLRLENDLTTALMLCAAAEARKETRGCHARVDFPEAEKQPMRVTLRQGAQGMAVAKETVSG